MFPVPIKVGAGAGSSAGRRHGKKRVNLIATDVLSAEYIVSHLSPKVFLEVERGEKLILNNNQLAKASETSKRLFFTLL